VFTGKLPLAGETIHPIDPLILSQTRTSFSLLVLLPMLVGRQGWQRIKLPRPDLIQCLVLGMLGVAASNYFYYVAIQKTSVAIAIILQYTAPVWVLLYVVARGQQKLSLPKVAAVGVALAGIALTIGIAGAKTASPLRLDSDFRVGLLALRQSSVESSCRALCSGAVGLPVRLLHDFGAGIVLSLFLGPAASRTNTRDHR
jgi:drug/metabolite transporter (DMT)-like permease